MLTELVEGSSLSPSSPGTLPEKRFKLRSRWAALSRPDNAFAWLVFAELRYCRSGLPGLATLESTIGFPAGLGVGAEGRGSTSGTLLLTGAPGAQPPGQTSAGAESDATQALLLVRHCRTDADLRG